MTEMHKFPIWMARFSTRDGEREYYQESFIPDATDYDDATRRAEEFLKDFWGDDTTVDEDGMAWGWCGEVCTELEFVCELKTLDDVVDRVGYL